MKASKFQLVSTTLALGLMAGAVGFQWHKLDRWDSVTSFQSEDDYSLVSDWPTEIMTVSRPGSDVVSPREEPSGNSEEMQATVTALHEIVSVLRELKEENQDLREEVKAANTEMIGMQMRLDTHSRSFRPLKIESEQAAPFNPPATAHPLLPPKPRH